MRNKRNTRTSPDGEPAHGPCELDRPRRHDLVQLLHGLLGRDAVVYDLRVSHARGLLPVTPPRRRNPSRLPPRDLHVDPRQPPLPRDHDGPAVFGADYYAVIF